MDKLLKKILENRQIIIIVLVGIFVIVGAIIFKFVWWVSYALLLIGGILLFVSAILDIVEKEMNKNILKKSEDEK